MGLRALVLMHTESNAGFAIAPLEATFVQVLRDLGALDPDDIHFAYAGMERGFPESLPAGTRTLDLGAGCKFEVDRLPGYARENRIDLVLAFDRQPVSPVYSALRDSGVRCIVSYWGAEISPRNPFWRRALKRIEIEVSRSRLDGLIFESHAMADLARLGRGVPERMIDVVPLGIDLDRFSPVADNYVREHFRHIGARKVVVYAGHMEPRKGVRFLVEAAVQLLHIERRTDVSFLLFGNRPGEEAAFEPLFKHLAIAEHIHFAGYRNDLSRCFPGCRVGVIPSSGWDSFPRTSIELAASGLPLVVSSLGGLPESVEDEKTGLLVPPGDTDALASKIRLLLDDDELAQGMGAAGRQRAEMLYSIHAQRKRLGDALKRRLQLVGRS